MMTPGDAMNQKLTILYSLYPYPLHDSGFYQVLNETIDRQEQDK